MDNDGKKVLNRIMIAKRKSSIAERFVEKTKKGI